MKRIRHRHASCKRGTRRLPSENDVHILMQEAVTHTSSPEANAALVLLVLIFSQPDKWLERSDPRRCVVHDVLDWIEDEGLPMGRDWLIERAKRIVLAGMES